MLNHCFLNYLSQYDIFKIWCTYALILNSKCCIFVVDRRAHSIEYSSFSEKLFEIRPDLGNIITVYCT